MFEKEELIPVIVQNNNSGEVLMLAYANKEALEKTLESKTAWFWSRSRKSLWNKGETSGNFLNIKDILIDCDQDTLIYKVEPAGPACHTGNRTCFYRRLNFKGEISDV